MGLIVLIVALALSAGLAVLYRGRNGRVRPAEPAPLVAQEPTQTTEVLRALVPEPGERATLLQFSTAFCAPCRTTRRTLAGVAEMVPGVRHLEFDAESHLDEVRVLEIRRTPTVIILGPQREVIARASGEPKRDEVIATLARVIPEHG